LLRRRERARVEGSRFGLDAVNSFLDQGARLVAENSRLCDVRTWPTAPMGRERFGIRLGRRELASACVLQRRAHRFGWVESPGFAFDSLGVCYAAGGEETRDHQGRFLNDVFGEAI
jgi:hypothetical protein